MKNCPDLAANVSILLPEIVIETESDDSRTTCDTRKFLDALITIGLKNLNQTMLSATNT